MIFSSNKTTYILVNGIATALLVKQSMLSRILVLTNTGLNIYANNFSKNPKHIKISKYLQFLTNCNIAKESIKHKETKKGIFFVSTNLAQDLIK